MSIGIQRETGGNLAGVLTGLAHVIRERARMFLKVRALSAEGRISALVLCVLPFGVGAMIFLGNPGYYTKVADDPLFLPGLSLAIFNLVLGIFMIRSEEHTSELQSLMRISYAFSCLKKK